MRLFSNSPYEVKIGPVWSMNIGIEANVFCKPQKKLFHRGAVYKK
jgi:hypothetical protein